MWNRTFQKTDDVESGATEPLYPAMIESPELRWSFIRKIYSIVAIQLILTVVVGAFVVSYHPVVTFLTTTRGGLACYILIIVTPFITLCPLSCYYKSHPVNYVLLAIFTVALAFAIGLSCAFTSGKLITNGLIVFFLQFLLKIISTSLSNFNNSALLKFFEFQPSDALKTIPTRSGRNCDRVRSQVGVSPLSTPEPDPGKRGNNERVSENA
ncbi:hypothetical protein OSB04_020207 [Centaurea solstitialis]|uniref:BI1-like protein n=1 Tax=Centaurea solstitialis TaxID=347529 RepID=A0AA38SRS7_9ASTR|nr:hypothetical protein OSB04_020207 [Centaurea solstitialis]